MLVTLVPKLLIVMVANKTHTHTSVNKTTHHIVGRSTYGTPMEAKGQHVFHTLSAMVRRKPMRVWAAAAAAKGARSSMLQGCIPSLKQEARTPLEKYVENIEIGLKRV